MVKAESKNGLTGVRPASVCIGALVGLAVTMLLMLLGAGLINGEKLPPSGARFFVLFASFVGTFIGALFAAKRNRRAYLLCGAAVGLLLYAMRILGALLSDGGAVFSGYAIELLAVTAVSAIFGGLLVGRSKKKRKR